MLHAGPQQVFQLPALGLGDQLLHQGGGQLFEDAVGLAVFIQFKLAAGDLGGIPGDAGYLQSFGVNHCHMAAGAGKDKGVLGGDFIQIVAVEHPVLVGEVIMVPPAAGDDRTRGGVVFCKKIPAALDALFNGGGAHQIDGAQV